MSVAIGPAFAPLEYRSGAKLDASFRVLVDYHIGTDSWTVRLDALKSGVQMNVGFHVHTAGSELRMPAKYDGFSVRANSQDLIDSLRGLADRLEQQLKEDSEKRASHD